ncbi:hypothetical protein HRbin17_02163 [bacterium HR17]|uniref:Uncharacterized protein n=1 Tax=Candidatus Fervidibacter japonicus TaxID=2035412 RepID=A0A2H5XEN8_9BACT|nr:hypothetical protein HRbin17_02163 [bacterium HR17]
MNERSLSVARPHLTARLQPIVRHVFQKFARSKAGEQR